MWNLLHCLAVWYKKLQIMLNSDGHQFPQYQQHEKSPLILTTLTENACIITRPITLRYSSSFLRTVVSGVLHNWFVLSSCITTKLYSAFSNKRIEQIMKDTIWRVIDISFILDNQGVIVIRSSLIIILIYPKRRFSRMMKSIGAWSVLWWCMHCEAYILQC
jgi:hypothetical protein